MILDAKSNLAKLMATENIIVEQKKASTAHFNLETRTLVIPILKQDLSSDLYDLFIGHEVGHALNTPTQGWHDSIIECGVNRSILNVCEDVRIEKLIRRKFPGLKTSFIRAYKELIDLDFFGLKDLEDFSELNLIDRMNLHTKCGVALGIKFKPAEAVLLEEAEQTETWEEVVAVAKRIQEFMKQEMEERKQQKQNEKAPTTEKNKESQAPDTEGKGDDLEADGEDSPSGSTQGNDLNDEIESKTDNAFREKEKELHDNSTSDLRYGNIPNLDAKDFIIDYKDLYSRVHELSESHQIEWDTGLYTDFRKNTVKVVSYLTKEFELRKNADQHKRASVAKTGDLNMNRIYSYQFNEDIFKKMTIVPDGKSHGLIMFLDWSASMRDYIDDTIKQLLTLVLFCKNVNIPFEVYAFTSQWESNVYDAYGSVVEKKTEQFKPGDLYFPQNIKLLNLFSSRMSKVELSYAANVNLGQLYNQQDLRDFYLGCTPLNESIILAMDIVPKFQKKNHLQNVNTVFLTDGEGHSLTDVVNDNSGRYRSGNLVLRDPKTHVSIRADYKHYDTSTAFFHLLKQRTNSNVIGFRILSNRTMNNYLSNIHGEYGKVEKLKDEFRKNKSCVIQGFGYDEYYLLKSDALGTDDEELEVKSTTTRSLVSAFKKYTKGNITNRVILNRFIGLIS
jgi:hypothetical protein